MKQLLYITIAILLSACSNDNAIDNSINSNKTTYPVSFNITNGSFKIDESTLKATEDGTKLRLYVYFYNSEGKIANFEEKTYDLNASGSYPYTKDLLPAKYYVAFLAIKDNGTLNSNSPLIIPQNFFSDYYSTANTTENIYYETAELTVVADNNATQTENINIKPMWSQLNVKIGDAQTFDVPVGTEALRFNVTPNMYGFGIENKLASKTIKELYPNSSYKIADASIVKIDSIRQNPTFTYTTSVSKTSVDNTLSINIQYVKLENDTVSEILQTRQLKIANTQIDNGSIYNVKGNLGSATSRDAFNISLGEFNKEDVAIEF